MSTTPSVWKGLFKANTTDAPPTGMNGDPAPGIGANNTQSNSKVIALTGGGFVVVWEDSSTWFASGLEPRDIVGQRYDASGNKVGVEFNASGTYLDLDQKMADIAALPGGGFICVYQTTDAAAVGDGENVTVEVFDATGARIRTDDFRQAAGPTPTGPPNDLDDENPSVVVFADGSYVVMFQQSTIGGGTKELVGYSVSSAGVVNTTKFDIVSGAAAVNETNPDSALLTNGKYVVVYEQANASSDIKLVIRDKAGGAPIAKTVASGTGSETKPVVAALKGGGFVVVWQDSNGDGAGNMGVKARIFDNNGIGGATFTVPTRTAGVQKEPAVTALSDGGFMVAWEDDAATSVLGQHFSATGAKLGSVVTLASLTGGASEPSLALLSNGRFVTSVTKGGANKDVYAAIFDPVNHLPTDIKLSKSTVKEFAAKGTTVGLLSTVDADGTHDKYTYTLLDDAGGRFALSGTKLFVKNGLKLDYEQATSDTVKIKVTDQGGLSRTETMKISILNVSPENVTGNSTANKFVGGSGADTLRGLAGNDILIGAGGKDVLIGGAGKDTMTGGLGADRFDFDKVSDIGKGSTRDIIKDFSTSGGDLIDLKTIDANGSAAGDKFTFLAAKGAAFTGHKGDLHWYQSGSKTFVEGDTNGDKHADFQIDLTGLKSLTAGDFVL